MISRRWGAMGALACGVLVAGCGNSDNGPTLGVDGGSGGAGNGQGGGAGSGAAGSGTGGTSSTTGEAGIEMRIATPAVSSGGLNQLLAFAGGGAVRPGLESLEYYIFSVQICESLEASGSGFNNPTGCLELYSGDRSAYNYDLEGDWTSLAAAARGSDTGFVDLIDPSARATLGRTRTLRTDRRCASP